MSFELGYWRGFGQIHSCQKTKILFGFLDKLGRIFKAANTFRFFGQKFDQHQVSILTQGT